MIFDTSKSRSTDCGLKSKDLFFELLLVAAGARGHLAKSYSKEEWEMAYVIANQQAIVGVLMTSIEVLLENNSELPSKELLFQWIGMTQLIEQNSQKLTKASEETVKYFRENGFECSILKGVSVGQYYPNPNRRNSGDVDVWLKGGRKKIYDFARKHDNEGKLHGVTFHHIHFHLFDDVEVEVHIWPSYLSSPLRNHWLQQFCKLHEPTADTDVPSLAFNRVFIMLHAYQHICGHGVGLRQIMDYFYILKQGFTEEERTDSVKWIKRLGMGKFCAGLMWLLQEKFGLKDQYLLMEPNEKEGVFILNEIMLTGNMGHSETRNWGSTRTPFSRFFFNLRRDNYLLTHYPHEALWQPFFSLWFYAWRLNRGLLKD